jgi:hypothetical protein
MCLVAYPEVLNRHIHDPLMKCIESDIGQSSENLADALNRTYTIDGKIILQALHAEGQLKKVNTEQVIVTPAPNTRIKLNELNKILDEMKQGEAAVKRLAELDSSTGLQDPADVARRMRNNKEPVVSQSTDVLGDHQIANNLRTQAERMATEARGLLAESERMMSEANQMLGVSVEKKTTRKTKAATVAPVEQPKVVAKTRVKKPKVEA